MKDTARDTAEGNTDSCLSAMRYWDTVACCLCTMHRIQVRSKGREREQRRVTRSGIESKMDMLILTVTGMEFFYIGIYLRVCGHVLPNTVMFHNHCNFVLIFIFLTIVSHI